MRRVAVIGVAMVLSVSASAESVRETVAAKYGEAVAIAERCPALAINSARMSAYLLGLNLTLDDAMKGLIEINRNRALTTLHDRSDADACAVGEMLYGPKGTNGPHLLKWE